MTRLVSLALATTLVVAALPRVDAQRAAPRPPKEDSLTVRVVNIDLRSAVQLMGQYLDWPLIFNGTASTQVTLETPRPVPRQSVAVRVRK